MITMMERASALGELPTLQAKLVSTGISGQSFTGMSVAITPGGTRAVVGSPGIFEGTGIVSVFDQIGSVWTQTATLNAISGVFSLEGFRVAISATGDTVITGDGQFNNLKGVVFVFQKSGNTWSNTFNLTESDSASGAGLGSDSGITVSLDSNTIACGRLPTAGNKGGIVVFVRSTGTSWTQHGPRITPSSMTDGSRVGNNLALSANGSILAFGAPNDNSAAGSIYVYTRNASLVWNQKGSAIQVSSGFVFGKAMCMSADAKIIASTTLSISPTEAPLHVFVWNGASYALLQSILAPSTASTVFGSSTAISTSGTRLIVGDFQANFRASPKKIFQGAVFVYDRLFGANFSLVSGNVTTNGLLSSEAIDNYYSHFGRYAIGVSNENHVIVGAFADQNRTGKRSALTAIVKV